MFAKILIANRGEIACRVIRTARRMGVATVAVHSDADRGALFVREADEAVRIGPAPASESYLNGAAIIAAALATGAQAIHPGYGFLSENPDFVTAVESAGLVFVGPPASAISAMGLKDAAKALMEKAGVPVVPGYHGHGQALVLLAGKAHEIGYPVMIKARAGGGGRGMRRVDRPEDFSDALSAARREAKAAFGDDAVLVEKYVERPRHIEVQVFADAHGNAVHLFERDCSAQRRHQKVVEEAPAPDMPADMREAMTAAAVKAALAIGYRGAGTIEFIADASEGLRADRFWFMEMNTRLQVEHPVTEMVTGVDLVEWQLRVAAGERLPLSQDAIRLAGHAVEARLYAEDPARGFLPAIGTLHRLAFPATDATLRVETGVAQGDGVSPHYDAMVAKLVAHGATRQQALDRLSAALSDTRIAGLKTNRGFLRRLVDDASFRAGDVDTGLIARHEQALVTEPAADRLAVAWALAAAAGLLDTRAGGQDPWDSLAGYAHFTPLVRRAAVADGEATHEAAITVEGPGRIRVALGDGSIQTLRTADGPDFAAWPGYVTVFDRHGAHDFALPEAHDREAEEASGPGNVRAPMPGLVKLVRAARGDEVARGQPLLVLEAMKMEHAIGAPRAGRIAEIVAAGSQIAEGTVLVRFEHDGSKT